LIDPLAQQLASSSELSKNPERNPQGPSIGLFRQQRAFAEPAALD